MCLKSPKLNELISMLKLCLGFLLDTLFCVKWLARLSIFIHAGILVLVTEFVVVVFLSEWWSVLTTVGTSLINVSYVRMCKIYKYFFGEVMFITKVRSRLVMHSNFKVVTLL